MIQQKPIKKCKHCKADFKPYKSTDKYCCFSCFAKAEGAKKKQVSKPIKKVSDKMKEQLKQYNKLRKAFIYLAQDNSVFCTAYYHAYGIKKEVTEVHHKAGRVGKLLLYVPYWLPVSREGHRWIHDNPKEAYKAGFLISSTKQ